jgi:DNA-binding response OmpR family regulator
VPIRVLIVDDEPDVLQSLVDALEACDYTVLGVASADAALQACELRTFDVALLDFVIPPSNGLELLARIRQVQASIRSIILSGKILDKTAAEVAEILRDRVDPDLYLTKPANLDELDRAIQELTKTDPEENYQALAMRMEKGRKATVKAAAEAAKLLRPKKK